MERGSEKSWASFPLNPGSRSGRGLVALAVRRLHARGASPLPGGGILCAIDRPPRVRLNTCWVVRMNATDLLMTAAQTSDCVFVHGQLVANHVYVVNGPPHRDHRLGRCRDHPALPGHARLRQSAIAGVPGCVRLAGRQGFSPPATESCPIPRGSGFCQHPRTGIDGSVDAMGICARVTVQ